MLAGAALILVAGLGSAPLERAEIYFLDGARTMVEGGDYLVPRYRGEPFFDKPALAYWLMAAAFGLFGFQPEAARLVSVLAALATVAVTVWLGSLLLSRRSALAGGAVLATTVAFVTFGRVAMADMLLTLWSTLAVTLAVAAWPPRGSTWLLPALGAVMGLGFLTKGPIAVLLPGFGIALLLWRERHRQARWTAGALALGVLLFAIFGLGWFAAVHRRLGWEPLAHFFLRENLERFAGETYDTGRAPWYYLFTYLAEGIPWSLFLPLALYRQWRPRAGAPGHEGMGLLLGWMGLMAIPLSLSRGKIDYYLLPLYPPASLAVGHILSSPWGRLERAWGRVVMILVAAGLALLALAPARLPAEWLPGPAARGLLTVIVVSGCFACLTVAARISAGGALACLGAVTATLFLCLAGLFLPAFAAAQPHAAIVEDASRELRYRPGATVVLCEDPTRVWRDLLFHARIAVQQRCDLWDPASSRHPFLLLLRPPERATLAQVPGLRVVSEHRYLPATALTLRGLLRGPRPEGLTLAANYVTDDPVAESKRKRDRKRALRELE